MKLRQRLLVLLITVTMLLPGSFVQVFAANEAVDGGSVAASETAADSETVTEAAEETGVDEAPAADAEASDTAVSAETDSNAEADAAAAENSTEAEAATDTAAASEDASAEAAEETASPAEEAAEETAAPAEDGDGEIRDYVEPSEEAAEETADPVETAGPDLSADAETAKDWEKTIPADLSDDLRKAVVQTAESQLKYKESAANYTEDKNGRHAYTRYGEFAGEPYADEWDAEFVLFVLNYSGAGDFAKALKSDDSTADQGNGLRVPAETDTEKWVKALEKAGLFTAVDDKEYKAEKGDLVFFDYDKEDSEHAKGLVAGIVTKADEGRLEVILASTGTDRNQVVKLSCGTEDVAGYVSLMAITPAKFEKEAEAVEEAEAAAEAEQTSEPAEETAEEAEAETAQTETAAEATAAEGPVDKTINAEITKAEKKGLLKLFSGRDNDAVITLTGDIPENAHAVAVPADVKIKGEKVLAAYDITIYTTDENGESIEWQPATPLNVSITDSRIKDADTEAGLDVYHMETKNAKPQLVAETQADGGKVEFEAESFSIYAVSAPTNYRIYELYLDSGFTQQYEFEVDGEEVTDPDTAELKTNRIIVKDGDTLEFPAAPEDVTDFRGWFTEDDEEVLPGVVSVSTQGDIVKLYARSDSTAYVVFHENQITESEGSGTTTYFPVSSTSKVLLENGSGTIDISQIEPHISYEGFEFIGWSVSDADDREVIDAAQAVAAANIDSYADGVLTITGTVKLYPVFSSVKYVRFYTGEVGSGATFIASSAVSEGNPLSDAKPLNSEGEVIEPTWKGYEFLGWTTADKITESGNIDYSKLIVWPGQSAPSYFESSAWDSQTAPVNDDMMLYAVWKPVDSAPYVVQVWYQSINDEVGLDQGEKTYVLFSSDTSRSGAPGTLIDYTTEVGASADGIVTPSGFEFDRGESATIQPDGSTIINVYYDRKTYTVVVKPGQAYNGTVHEGGYVQTGDTAGKLYGTDNGSTYYEIEYRFKGWREGTGTYTGTVYNGTIIWFASAYGNPPGVPAGTIGYIRPNRIGITTSTAVAEYSWYKKGTNQEYTGSRYKQMEPYVAYYTGLYEQPIGFDYSMKYYYQPEESKHIRLSDILSNGNQYYLIRGDENAGRYYTGYRDNQVLYISSDDAHGITTTTTWSNNTYSAMLKDSTNSAPDTNECFKFPAGSVVETPDLEAVELAAFNFENTDSEYQFVDLAEESNNEHLYKVTRSTFIFWFIYNSARTDVSLYKVNSIGEKTNNFDSESNTLTVFANSETDTYPATTSYYKADAPDTSASGFAPYATYDAFLDEFKGKVEDGSAAKLGGSGQTGTTADVSALMGQDAVLNGYTYTQYNNGSWHDAAGTVSTSGSNTDIKLLFEPNNVTVSFKYDSDGQGTYVDAGSIQIPRGFSFDCFTESGNNPNAEYVSDYKDGEGVTPPAGKVFAGWSYDVSGQQDFDTSRTVTSDITVYAKYEIAEVTVNIDPRGGTIEGGSAGSTFFWRDIGQDITPYENVRRDYVESESGTYYYFYNDLATCEANNNYDYRASGYVLVSDLDSWTKIDETTYKDGDGKLYCNVDKSVKYAYNNRAWKFVAWFDASTDAPYDFSSPVTEDTYIYAVWKNVDTYKLRFDAGDGNYVVFNIEDVVDTQDEAGAQTCTLKDRFIDGADVVIPYSAAAGSNPADPENQFRGWRMKLSDTKLDDTVYQLGELFQVDYQYADDNGVITLAAVYGKLDTTDLTYEANGGTGTLKDLSGDKLGKSVDKDGKRHGHVKAANANKIENLLMNDTVELSDGSGFTRSSQVIIGWSTDPDRMFGDFDPEANLNVDFDLGQEVLVDDIDSNVLYAVWKPLPAPTAVNQKYMPYILVIIAAASLAAAAVTARRRRENPAQEAEEEA